MDPNERYSRQRDIVPADRLRDCRIAIVGVGAVGRHLALQLASVGATQLTVVDFDTVEESNIASQGYLECDLGRPKVRATAEQCRRINSSVQVIEINDRFRASLQLGDVVFCAVDKIATRELIWRAVKNRVRLFCDARVAAETIRVLTACDPASRRHYATTLFSQGEAYVGPCTSRMTIFAANVAAGMMI
ncbi:hypothetical protein LCGC14_1744740, partial [marine sediment metagenome]